MVFGGCSSEKGKGVGALSLISSDYPVQGPLPRELFDEFIVLLLMDLERVYFPGFLASSCFTGMVQLQHYVSTQPTVSHNDFQWLGRIGRGGMFVSLRHRLSWYDLVSLGYRLWVSVLLPTQDVGKVICREMHGQATD